MIGYDYDKVKGANLYVNVSDGREDPSNCSYDSSQVRLDHHVSSRAYGHTSCQSGILDMHLPHNYSH
jgi:hypothetical protein